MGTDGLAERLLPASPRQQSQRDCVIDTVQAGGDTDTNAAIAGALLSAVQGRRGMLGRWMGRGADLSRNSKLVGPFEATSRNLPARRCPRSGGTVAAGSPVNFSSQATFLTTGDQVTQKCQEQRRFPSCLKVDLRSH